VPQAPLPLPACGERSDRASDPGEGPMHDSSSWRLPLTRRLRRRPLPASGERWRPRPPPVIKFASGRCNNDHCGYVGQRLGGA
jgi:hypothetical protein